MWKRKHGMRLMALVLLLVLGIVGCGVRAHVSAYVEGALNAAYKADYTSYMRMTECSQSEAQKLHEDRLDGCMAVLAQAEISDELKEKYRKLFDRVLGSVRYSVEQETEEDGVYEVQLKVEPYSMFEGIAEELDQDVDEYYTQVTQAALNGTPIPTDDEAREKVYELLLNILTNRMNHITYGDEMTVTIHVTKQNGNTFSIVSEDLQALDEILIDLEAMGL